MNTAIKTHWRLAFRMTKKAIAVTFQTAIAAVRAMIYSNNVEADNQRMKMVFDTFTENQDGKKVMTFFDEERVEANNETY